MHGVVVHDVCKLANKKFKYNKSVIDTTHNTAQSVKAYKKNDTLTARQCIV